MPPATHCSASSHGRRWETFPPSAAALLPFRVPFFFPFAPPPAFLSQLYKLPLFSLLFPRLQPRLLEEEVGGGGKHAKRCGIYLSFLAPVAAFHKALWPFPFTPSSLILLPSSRLLSLPSYLSEKKKDHSGLSGQPVPALAFLLLLLLSFFLPLRVLLKWAEEHKTSWVTTEQSMCKYCHRHRTR